MPTLAAYNNTEPSVTVGSLKGLILTATTGGEVGANGLFVPGGKTEGGVSEGVVNGIPKTGTGVTTSTVPKL